MLIYRYLKSHALETIRDGLLKVSRLSEFNDPFEGMFGMPDTLSVAEAKEHIEEESKRTLIQYSPDLLAKKPNLSLIIRDYVKGYPEKRRAFLASWNVARDNFLLVGSFTSSTVRPQDEVLMWSHYADHHRGTRIGFEIGTQKTSTYSLEEVDYSSNRVIISLLDDNSKSGKLMYKAYKTKSKVWEYEAEKRLLVARKRCVKTQSQGKEIFCFRYPLEWVRSVDFGAEFPSAEMAPLIDFVRTSQRPIQLRKARYHESEFALVYDEIKV